MKYYITKNQGPAYLQIYRQIREDIVNGIYAYGNKLPSKRTLADELAVSIITIEHAYSILADEGYIESRERSGYYVIFRAIDGFASSTQKVYPSVKSEKSNFEINSDFPISVLTKTMRSVMSEYGENILSKTPNSGCSELRYALQQYLARSRGIVADCEQIIIGSGSEYLYTLIVELLGRQKVYAIESPSYKKIEQVYISEDIKFQKLSLGTDGIKSSELWKCDADILHVSPYRSFPSGVTATASKRHEYILWASKQNRVIIEDDFESEFSVSTKPEETLFSYSSNDNIIYMNTFSKTVSPALRTGYMVLPKHLISEFEKKLGFYSCTVPTFIQLVLAELISNGDFERHINKVRRQKRKELQN